jgi:hypothetical protein
LKQMNTRVYVMTGPATFSAGMSHAAQWKKWANAKLVGEPIGDVLDYFAEGGNLLLPNSKLTVHYANAAHRYSDRDYPERKPYFYELVVGNLDPDMPIETTWKDYISGKDPVLDAIVR